MLNATNKARAYDNRETQMTVVQDASRPFVAIKPMGYHNPVIGFYATLKGAKAAAARWNKNNAAD